MNCTSHRTGLTYPTHKYRGTPECVRCGEARSKGKAWRPTPDTRPSPRRGGRQGFASMSLEQRRRIASLGGKAAHAQRTAHEWTSEEAMHAGRKGAARTNAKRAETNRATTSFEA